MELTRRDAVKAMLVGGGAAGGSLIASEALSGTGDTRTDGEYTDGDIDAMVGVAEVVYPSEVEVTTGFIEPYVARLSDERQGALSETISDLDAATRARFGRPFTDEQSASSREAMLRSLGVHRVESRPAGNVPERVRYHLVNTLLYALFTSPKGSELVGIVSPLGHPGGFGYYHDD